MAKTIFKIIAVFIFGTAGGIFADQILWPYFIERPLFYQYGLDKPPVYVTEIKEVTIQEESALILAVEKVERAVIGLKTKTKTGKILEGAGLILTSDGLIVTLSDLLPQPAEFYFWVDGEWPKFQVLKRDVKNNLALVKVEKTNLPTVSFADLEKLKLAEKVFLVAAVFGQDPQTKFFSSPAKIVNQGIVRSLSPETIQTTILEKSSLQGSPLFNLQSELVGLARIDADGRVTAVPASKIRAFTGL